MNHLKTNKSDYSYMRFLPPICSQLKLSSVFLIKSQLSLYYVAFYEKSVQGKQSGSGFRL